MPAKTPAVPTPPAPLVTPRLELRPITLPMVEAVLAGERARAEALIGARLPDAWPGRKLLERAFVLRLDDIRADPARRLWGDRVMIAREGPRVVVGSVVFHGAPGDDGAIEIAYGVEEASQGRGLATEAVGASVAWAFEHDFVEKVRATAPLWHAASRRVLEKVGLREVGRADHELLGELVLLERGRG